MNKDNKYNSIDELYRDCLPQMMALARSYLRQKDLAQDAVHNAILNILPYFNKYPHKRVNRNILFSRVIRACKKINKANLDLM